LTIYPQRQMQGRFDDLGELIDALRR